MGKQWLDYKANTSTAVAGDENNFRKNRNRAKAKMMDAVTWWKYDKSHDTDLAIDKGNKGVFTLREIITKRR